MHPANIQTTANLKERKLNNNKLLDWLNTNKVFIKADTLGYKTTKVIGFLLHMYLPVVHRDALKKHWWTSFSNSPSTCNKLSHWIQWQLITTNVPWIVVTTLTHMSHPSRYSIPWSATCKMEHMSPPEQLASTAIPITMLWLFLELFS